MFTIKETRQVGGQVELADPASVADSRYANPELLPVPLSKRTWTTYNYIAIWMGMAHAISSYLLASGLIVLGMSWLQAFLTITVANLLVLIPMLLNSHAGTKYGIPYPVFARAFFGVRGANLAALLRALVACGWFGIQTWIGGQAIYTVVGRLTSASWTNASSFGGQPWTLWVSFAAFWLVQMALIWRGIDALRRFENWAAPMVTLAFTALLVYMLVKAGGIGPILHQTGSLGWGSKFWVVFWPSLMAMIAYWATLSLNMPDFTRFSKGQKQQVWGQVLGLPTTMSVHRDRVDHRHVGRYGRVPHDDLGPGRADHEVLIDSLRRHRADHDHPGDDVSERCGQRGVAIIRLLQHRSAVRVLQDRRADHRGNRDRDPALAAAVGPACVHLHLARLLRRSPRHDRRRANRRRTGCGGARRCRSARCTPRPGGTGSQAAGTGGRWWPRSPARCCRSAGRIPRPAPGDRSPRTG